MSKRKTKPTRPDPGKPMTINQMIALFREVLEAAPPRS